MLLAAIQKKRTGQITATEFMLTSVLTLLLSSPASSQTFSPEFQQFKNQQQQRINQQEQLEQDRLLEEQIKRENICERKEVQTILIDTFNGVDTLTKSHGRIVFLRNMTTTMVMLRAGHLTCFGTYSFQDGETKDMAFAFPYRIHSY